ncbi:hypothetical protein GCM10009535_01940 [Streptomyces thermocarboxydovorans]|uniref:histidine kinase n=1 Tax=Streptomyces thermocarboxydovorans TaxID=59298 RepID=A0ABN1H6D8_9ACTN
MRPPRRSPTARAEAPPPPPRRGRRAHAGPPADEGPDPRGTAAPARAGRRLSGPRTVRAKIVCLLMVPVVSLLALWGHATVTTAQDIAELRQIQRVDAKVRAPLAAAVAALQAERSVAVRRVSDASSVADGDLTERARATDRAVARLKLGDNGTVAYGQELPRTVADLRGPERTAWDELARGDAYAALAATEDKVLSGGTGTRAVQAAPARTWNAAHTRVRDGMRAIEDEAGRGVARRADPLTCGLLTPAGAAVLFGLAAVAASLVISVRIGRGLVVELVRLRNDALEIARRKLPEAMRRLRAGEEIDIDAEAPPGPPAQDETGQVAEALGTVHRAALHAAVERAELAGGISGVFVNLARRSQVLVHRQLSLLDSMERRSDDPGELSDLFRLDHLTTRMRRHAESLIILSGAAPGRAWRMPVSLTNVVRAAVSEVEDYARVEVRQLPEASVVGAAVADLTHLLAELIENAAQFSPPHTRVRVTGEPVGNGYAIEVEDRGLGMGKESLAEANRRIQSEALDLFDSDRLGLFVVSRLAARHDIKVHLKTSPYGGTTAVVLLPTSLLNDSTEDRSPGEIRPARPAEERAFVSVAGDGATHARMSRDLPRQRAVPAPDQRPSLVAPAAPPTDATDTAAPNPPQGAAPLRLHRPPQEPAGSDDLPRRVRQASLAPQLREHRPGTPAPARHDEDERTPELVRDRMAAYRAGWARGGGRQPGRGGAPGPHRQHDGSEGDPA